MNLEGITKRELGEEYLKLNQSGTIDNPEYLDSVAKILTPFMTGGITSHKLRTVYLPVFSLENNLFWSPVEERLYESTNIIPGVASGQFLLLDRLGNHKGEGQQGLEDSGKRAGSNMVGLVGEEATITHVDERFRNIRNFYILNIFNPESQQAIILMDKYSSKIDEINAIVKKYVPEAKYK